jgi:hypothetical protein
MNAGLTAASWLDWKLGARLLLKYPALTIIGGLSLGGPSRLGRSASKSPTNCCTNGCRSMKAPSRAPRDAGHGSVTRGAEVLHDFAIWRRSLKTVTELGAARVSERNVLTGEGRVESLRVRRSRRLRFRSPVCRRCSAGRSAG